MEKSYYGYEKSSRDHHMRYIYWLVWFSIFQFLILIQCLQTLHCQYIRVAMVWEIEIYSRLEKSEENGNWSGRNGNSRKVWKMQRKNELDLKKDLQINIWSEENLLIWSNFSKSWWFGAFQKNNWYLNLPAKNVWHTAHFAIFLERP